MGAGSAKGVNPENSDDADRFSTSSDHWENDPPATKAAKENVKNNNIPTTITATKVVAEAPIASTSSTTAASVENAMDEDKRDDAKKKPRFGFGRKKEDELAGESSETTKDIADKSSKDKKEADKKGFKLFGWRKDEKKAEEKDAALDEDLDDLEKTFDSLGIVGKSMWGTEQPDKKDNTPDDIEMLEPMRNRKNVKVRGGKRTNGASNSSGSNGSKRTFKFSWETEGEKEPAREEEDEWEYKAVVIEGFDIEKFRKANLKDSVFDSTSLPNAVGGGDAADPGGTKSPLRYDQTEQYILASIERDFMH